MSINARLMKGIEYITNDDEFAEKRDAVLARAFRKIITDGLNGTLAWKRFGDGLLGDMVVGTELELSAADGTPVRAVVVLKKKPGVLILRIQDNYVEDANAPSADQIDFPLLLPLATKIFGK